MEFPEVSICQNNLEPARTPLAQAFESFISRVDGFVMLRFANINTVLLQTATFNQPDSPPPNLKIQ